MMKTEIKVKETPILFSADMVRAILDGRKTMIRRVIPVKFWNDWGYGGLFRDYALSYCPYGQVGDKLWVRETWRLDHENPIRDGGSGAIVAYDEPTIMYKADKQPHIQALFKDWKPSIHMFKEYARIWLEITSVRVERLQEITVEDSKKEGVEWPPLFKDLWNSLNEKRGRIHKWEDDDGVIRTERIYENYGWKVNPWVWVIEFKGSNNGK